MWQVDMSYAEFEAQSWVPDPGEKDPLKSRVVDAKTGTVLRVWTGECAWSDADRYAYDMFVSHLYGGNKQSILRSL